MCDHLVTCRQCGNIYTTYPRKICFACEKENAIESGELDSLDDEFAYDPDFDPVYDAIYHSDIDHNKQKGDSDA